MILSAFIEFVVLRLVHDVRVSKSSGKRKERVTWLVFSIVPSTYKSSVPVGYINKMFWRVSGLNTACPVDTILDKDEFTLEELMDEDELVQECKSLNPRLTEFLKSKENVGKLVKYLVEAPEDDADDKRTFKYPFTACEVFCCEVEGIYNTLLENNDLLDQLFGILENERPLNTILAGYFSRVVGALLARRSGDLVQYLKQKDGVLKQLVYHVDTTSVAEVLARLAGADDPVGYSDSPSVVWLADTEVLQLLVASLDADTPAEGQANAAEVLAAIARSTATQLTKNMASAEFMQTLVDSALAPHSGMAASHALNVCLALLEPLTVDPNMGRFPLTDVHNELRKEAVRCLSRGVDKLVVMMDRKENECIMSELPTTYGMIKPPMGQLRLKIVDLLASLFRTTDPVAEKAVIGTRAVQKAMNMFLEYPFNNALHGGVTMLLTSFEEGSLELRKYLLEDVDIVDWLASAPTEVTPQANPDAAVNVNRKPLRAGYCGHLTQIANRLQRCAESCAYTKEFLEKNETWKVYKEQYLDGRNKIESVMSWKCGRPATQGMGMHGMYSADMAFSSLDCDFDSDHSRFANPGMEEEEDEENLAEWALKMKNSSENQSDLHWRDDSDSDSDEEEEAAKVLASSANEFLSMDDMQDDEVLLGEADASEGLLELGSSIENLSLGDSNKETVKSPENSLNDDGKDESSDAFNDNQFWPKYNVAVDEST